jgi:hypothetical protein
MQGELAIAGRSRDSRNSGQSHGRRSIAKGLIYDGRNAECYLIAVGHRNNLHADGEIFLRPADGYDCGGNRKRIEPLGVTHGV